MLGKIDAIITIIIDFINKNILLDFLVFGLFLFTAYGLPKLGYKIHKKRFIRNRP